MTIDLRDYDQREHAPRHGTLPDGKPPLEDADPEIVDYIAASLALAKYRREVKEREAGEGRA